MRRTLRHFILLGALFGGVFFLAAPQTHAASRKCDLQTSFKNFSSFVSDPTTDYSANTRNQLRVRRELLRSTLECALSDVKNLQSELAAIKTADSDIKKAAVILQGRLSEAAAYYESRLEALDELGIRATQETARGVRDWRAGILSPLAGNATNMGLWTRNEALIQKADGRFQQINRTATNLKLMDNEGIRKLLSQAGEHLSAAKKNQEEARQILIKLGSPEEALAKIKECLTHLSAAYDDFIAMSDEVKKILTR